MKRVIHSGIHRIEVLRWYECGPEDAFLEFYDPACASSFLHTFMRDHFNMMTLRGVLTDTSVCSDLCRLTDHDICHMLACQVVRGYLRLVPRVEEIPRILVVIPEEAEEEEAAPAPRRAAAATAAPVQPAAPTAATEVSEQVAEPEVEAPPVEEEPLVPVGAAVTQAATMVQAAETGAPFCDT